MALESQLAGSNYSCPTMIRLGSTNCYHMFASFLNGVCHQKLQLSHLERKMITLNTLDNLATAASSRNVIIDIVCTYNVQVGNLQQLNRLLTV